MAAEQSPAWLDTMISVRITMGSIIKYEPAAETANGADGRDKCEGDESCLYKSWVSAHIA
jgi:hypothetical protein